MYRLNKAAFEILVEELQICSGNDEITKIERQIVIKRWEKMRLGKGNPVSEEELKESVRDIFPQFSDKALKQAYKINQPPSVISKLLATGIFFSTIGGILFAIVWIVNLPFPMIRRPISEKAPLLLLPSYIQMDSSYRNAISSLEQADQLINKATSPEDVQKGAEKAQEAQRNLDNLPVWFLGYYPQLYCNLFSCNWKFTLDEFEEARRRVAKIQARAFQDKNALAPLASSEKEFTQAKQEYNTAKNSQDREKAIAGMQSAIDQLEQISNQTLAGENAKIKLKAYKRDLENARIGAYIAAAQEFDLQAEKIKLQQPKSSVELWQQAVNRLNQVPVENPRYLEAQRLMAMYQGKLKTTNDPRSGNLLEGARQFAFAAAQASQNPPHTTTEWEQITTLWQQAIHQLQSVKTDEVGYIEAQKMLATYQSNLGVVKNRLVMEQQSQILLKEANKKIENLIASAPKDKNILKAELQGIINILQNIQPGTTAYKEAQRLAANARKKL